MNSYTIDSQSITDCMIDFASENKMMEKEAHCRPLRPIRLRDDLSPKSWIIVLDDGASTSAQDGASVSLSLSVKKG